MPRTIVAVALLLVAGLSHAQTREGIYKPASGSPVPWSINEHQSLIWNGLPYLPYGLKIDGSPQAVAAAKAAGATDVLVDLPANGSGWDATISALNKANLHFLVRISSLPPMAHGFAVEPQGYRVTGIKESRDVTLEIPGATSAFVVLATKSDGTIVSSARVPVVGGKLTYSVKIGPELEHVLLVYPEMISPEQGDFWEGCDLERDELLNSLKRHPFGTGLRGIVNPMGTGIAQATKKPRFVSTSPVFQLEFSQFLQQKYKNVVALMRAWSLSSSELSQMDDVKKQWLTTFDRFAHMIPLWSSNRGVSALYEPETNSTYPCDNKHSKIWDDIAEVVNAARENRYAHLVPSVRSVVNVPIIEEWNGWVAPYETSSPTLDGIGLKALGSSPSAISDTGSRAASSILRWATHGWLVATELDPGPARDAVTQLPNTLDNLASMGARGVFLKSETPAVVKAMLSEAKTRSVDSTLSTSSPLPIFFPENAYNPAVPQQLPGDHWWLPTPSDGNRIDLGSLFFAYRSSLSEGTFALWARQPGRYRLRMDHAKSALFKTLDGSDPLPKFVKDGVEVQLTEVPLIISGTFEVPIPQLALLETLQRFELLVRIASSTKHTLGEEEMYFNDAASAFERNPGGSFEIMRREYGKLSDKIASYTWIEAERSADTNFSEVITEPGCSAGSALSLKTLVPPGPDGYYADYNVPVKTKEDQQLWIAARIPADRRADLSVIVGGQRLTISGDPISVYDGGFGWYKLGLTRLAGNVSKVRLRVESGGSSELAIDAILFTPGVFIPNAVTHPDAVDFSTMQTTQPKKSRRRGSGGS